jgi:hypothetical protein
MKAIKSVGQRFAGWLGLAEANQNVISLFDVKELYDAAYAEKARARVNVRTFRVLLEKAERLDAAYRVQMAAEQAVRFGKAA